MAKKNPEKATERETESNIKGAVRREGSLPAGKLTMILRWMNLQVKDHGDSTHPM